MDEATVNQVSQDILNEFNERSPADLYYVQQRETVATITAGKLAATTSRTRAGWFLRCIVDGKMGAASSSVPVHAPAFAGQAIAASTWGGKGRYDFSRDVVPAVALGEAEILQLAPDDIADLGDAVVMLMKEAWPEASCDVRVAARSEKVQTFSTCGGKSGYERRSLRFSMGLHVPVDGGVIRTGSVQSFRQIPSPVEIARGTLDKLLGPMNPVASVCGTYPVILMPSAIYSVLCPVERMLSGSTVMRGASALGDRLGEDVFSPSLTLRDVASDARAVNGAPVDDEGVAAKDRRLIDRGQVAGYYANLAVAQAMGVDAGNGLRVERLGLSVYESQPVPHPFSLCVEPGETAQDEFLGMIGDGLIVYDVLGTGQANNLNGDYAVGVTLGYLVRDGKLAGRVTGAMISGNVLEDLAGDLMCGREATWVSGYICSPAVVLPRVHVTDGRRR